VTYGPELIRLDVCQILRAFAKNFVAIHWLLTGRIVVIIGAPVLCVSRQPDMLSSVGYSMLSLVGTGVLCRRTYTAFSDGKCFFSESFR